MITNIPKSDDFTNVAKQCLLQAFNIVFEEDRYLNEDESLPRDDFWEYHLALLNTSVILIYQAIECLLKAKICEESALLLIDLKRENWPTGPESDDKDFNDLFTISGEALIKTYSATLGDEKLNQNLVNFVEEVRITRNKIIHGVSNQKLLPEYIGKCILETFNTFLGKDSWWNTTRELLINNPIFGIFNEDYEEADFIERLDYTENLVTKGYFNKQFEIDLKTRRYFCPWCYESLAEEGHDIESKWAFLIPQKQEDVEEIYCVNCKRTHKVERTDCNEEKCKGNVIFENENNNEKYCLTCYLEQ